MAEEERKPKSIQPRFSTTKDQAASWFWTYWERATEKLPKWGSRERVSYNRSLARNEPIMAGAVSSMSSRIAALDFEITGGRNRVKRFHSVLSEANDGEGWTSFVDPFTFDYWTSDLGGVAELGRESADDESPVQAIYTLDAAQLQLTGNHKYPLRYWPILDGQPVDLAPWHFMRAADMSAPEEAKYGLGFCAVSRALKAINVLIKVYNYEDEMLSDMPPQGIASITGMTDSEVEAAMRRYDAMRASKDQLTFKGVLWLVSSMSPLNQVKVDFSPFASIPEGFNKQEAIQIYIATLALCFGVDVREFWPFSSGPLGSGQEAQIQAEKAKGKGIGRVLSVIERAINWNVLPEGVEFAFDNKNSEEDMLKATIQGAQIANIRKLWEPGMAGEGLITTAEARRMLVETKAVPDWLIPTPETTASGENQSVEPSNQLQGAVETPPAPQTPASPAAALAAQPLAAAQRAAMQIAGMQAAKERLGRGEDFVAMNRRGDIRTLFSNRFYSISRPVPAFDPANWEGEFSEWEALLSRPPLPA